MKSKKILVYGVFNIIHPGHLRLLRFASEIEGELIVGVLSDNLAGNAAHIKESLRLNNIKTNSWVDNAFIVNTSIHDVIHKIKPDFVVKGREHEAKYNEEKDLIESYGGKLIFSSGESYFSSVDLLRKEFKSTSFSNINLPNNFMDRHSINNGNLIDIVKNFSSLKTCVIGDLIIDEYITCEPLGMSQEEPTIVVTPIDKIKFIGGAGIVAAHASGLGSNATLISVVGDDELANFATNELQKYNVDVEFIIDGNRPTTLKQRFRSRGKSLLRINIMHQDLICVSLQEMIFNKVKSIIKDLDLVVFSDFNYGCLPKNLVDKITKLAKLNNVFISADSQSSSQIGDIGRFKEMDLITPTEHEARISMRNNTDGLVILAEKLRSHSRSKYILLKLGEEGVIIHSKDFNNIKTHGSSKATDSIPSLNTYPKDVAGAGDSMLITSSLALASGANIFESSLLGSISASIQIGRVGNTPLKSQEIISEIE